VLGENSGVRAALRGSQIETVLIVEDEPHVCDLIDDIISEAGLQAECVSSDVAAYQALRANTYVALVVDVNLGPGTTGFDVARFARQIEPSIPVLYISGQATERSFAAYGVPNSEFVQKPFRAEELTQRLLSVIVH
jgi:DNA-binding response OmpR family regulator